MPPRPRTRAAKPEAPPTPSPLLAGLEPLKVGDLVVDREGRAWTLEATLGRGLWGRSWSVRHESGAVAVLKVPLHASDFAGRHDARELAALARAACEAQRDTVATRPYAELAPLLGLVDDALPEAASATGGYFLPRLPSDLDTRLRGGLSLQEAIGAIASITHALRRADIAHANLRPSNIFLAEEGRVILTDPHVGIDPTALRRLSDALPPRATWVPPEVQRGAVDAGGARAPMTDTWALCQLLLAVLRGVHGDPAHRTLSESLRDGLGRSDLAAVKDAGADRIAASDVPRRFAGRVTERLGAILSRGLSEADDPSPPYRFATLADLEARLEEVVDLMRPEVRHVSRPLLSSRAKDGVFDTGQPVAFTVNVTTSTGVVAPDDVVVGLVLRDLDGVNDDGSHVPGARVRAPGARVDVQRHHSGRWRYAFEIPDLSPGRYTLKVGVRIQDDASSLVEAEGSFVVRPSAGYVPPPAPSDAAAPLPPLRPPSGPPTGTTGVSPAAGPRPGVGEGSRDLREGPPAAVPATSVTPSGTASAAATAATAAVAALPDLFGRGTVGGPPMPIRPDSSGAWSGADARREGFERGTDAGTDAGTRWFDAGDGPPTLRSPSTVTSAGPPTITPAPTSPGTDPAWSVPARPAPARANVAWGAEPSPLGGGEPPQVLRPSTTQQDPPPRGPSRASGLDYPAATDATGGEDLAWRDAPSPDVTPDPYFDGEPQGPFGAALERARDRLAAWEAEGWDANTVIAGFAVAAILGIAILGGLIKSLLAG